MGTMPEILGFTTPEGIFWNSLAYVAVLLSIVGVLHEKSRFWLFTVAGAMLVVYSFLFLHSALFTVLQSVLVVSAVLQLLHVPKKIATSIFLILTAIAVSLVWVMSGTMPISLYVLGNAGFLAIAVGMLSVPKQDAFACMAFGGFLLATYAFLTGVWPFFALNLFFTGANIWEWIGHLTDKKMKNDS